MKLIVGILFLIMSSVSFANISGEWNGWGTWTYEGSGVKCNPMTLRFSETNNKLIRAGGYFDCEIVALDVSSGEWTKEGNNLLVDGEIVGTITDHSVHLVEKYSETVKVVSDITINGLHLDYSEMWLDKDDVLIYEIKGRLFKGSF
ncbi:MAG: hypothetical protein ACXVLQ_10550 [Bacteriovorax sp.]